MGPRGGAAWTREPGGQRRTAPGRHVRRGTREFYPGGSRRPRAPRARLRALSSLPVPAELFFRAGPAGNERRRAAEAVGAALTEGSWLWDVWFAAPPPRAGEALRPRRDGAADCAEPPREPPGMVRPHPAYQSRLENDAVLLCKGKLGQVMASGVLSLSACPARNALGRESSRDDTHEPQPPLLQGVRARPERAQGHGFPVIMNSGIRRGNGGDPEMSRLVPSLRVPLRMPRGNDVPLPTSVPHSSHTAAQHDTGPCFYVIKTLIT